VNSFQEMCRGLNQYAAMYLVRISKKLNLLKEINVMRMYMKKIAGFIGLAFLQLMVACSSLAPWETRQWQPTAVSDFKSVAADGRDF